MMRAATLLAAIASTACSTPPQQAASSIQTGVHCVATQPTTIIAGNQVHVVPGHCTSWSVGPTPTEARDAIEHRKPYPPHRGAPR